MQDLHSYGLNRSFIFSEESSVSSDDEVWADLKINYSRWSCFEKLLSDKLSYDEFCFIDKLFTKSAFKLEALNSDNLAFLRNRLSQYRVWRG